MSNKLWKNDKIQFARLISECMAEGVFTKEAYDKLAKAMDLEEAHIDELIERAQKVFQESKDSVNSVWKPCKK